MSKPEDNVRSFMGQAAIRELVEGLAQHLREELHRRGRTDPAMIGIHTGGAWIAELLHEQLGLSRPLGTLDISFYRDDFTRIGMNPEVRPSQIPFDVEGQHILLVDDVLQSGRTIRAALNEIFDYGRPASVTLAVLIQREGGELPIQPDVVGMTPSLERDEHIKLQGPEPLELVIGQAKRVKRGGDS